MRTEDVIKLLNNPVTIPKALTEISKIKFSGQDILLFNQKRLEYETGMNANRMIQWILEMTDFLNSYSYRFGDYSVDRDCRWHHLDRRIMKRKFKELYRDPTSKIKALLLEHNEDAFSSHSHDILHSFYAVEGHCTSNIKGSLSDFVLDMKRPGFFKQDWTEFVRFIFDLNVPFDEIPEAYKNKGLHRQSHFIFQSVDNFVYQNHEKYMNLWKLLEPSEPLFLFFHLPKGALVGLPEYSELFYFRHDEYEKVESIDLTRFLYDHKNFYKTDSDISSNEPISFSKALELLQYSA